jgi:hypothetical protein
LISAHLFEPAAQPPMTKEQAIRGKDAQMPWVVVVTGYDEDAVDGRVESGLAEAGIAVHGGAAGSVRGRYRLHGSLAEGERGAA